MVRMPRINKQKFLYANWSEGTTEYKTDADGNVLTVTVNGREAPIEKVVPAHYGFPRPFKASMNQGGGKAEAVEFGVDENSYNAILTTPKGYVDITETTLIWHESKPKFKADGTVDDNSADYNVVKVQSSLLYDRYLLQRRNKNGQGHGKKVI